MERLESFVAGALLQRLRQADADADAACTSFRGAVLFVDISGYTVLAETLCGQGADGIEQLGRMLDAAFRGHVRAVHDTGGEIACFAGDAFIAYWSADDGNVPRALAQAHDCARALHVRLRSDVAAVPSTATPASPPLHIGVGAGEIWAARLGAGSMAVAARRARCPRRLRRGGSRRRRGDDRRRQPPGRSCATPAALAPPTPGDAPGGRSTARPMDGVGQVNRARPGITGRRLFARGFPSGGTICALFVRIDGLDDTHARGAGTASGRRDVAARRAASLHRFERHAAARRQGARVHAVPRHAPRRACRRCAARGAGRAGGAGGAVAAGPRCAIGVADGPASACRSEGPSAGTTGRWAVSCTSPAG